MKFKFILLVLSAFLLGFKPPQKNATSTPQKIKLDQPLSGNNSLLWQISGNGLKQASYLFGTMHVISAEDYFLGKNTEKKLAQSDALILELDLDMENINVAALTSLSVLDSGKTIKNYLSDSDYALVRTFMEDSIGINKFTFEMFYARLKPFYLEQLIYLQKIGQEKELYEINLQKLANKKNTPILGLETFEEQLQFLESIPLTTQFNSVLKTIKEYTSESETFDKLVNDYKAQDITALAKSIESEQDSVWNTNLLVKRNHNWITKLKLNMQQKACFIAVGAGHLGGQNGLIELLKKEGYTVEPISIN